MEQLRDRARGLRVERRGVACYEWPALIPRAMVRSEPELLLKSMFEYTQAVARIPVNVLGLYYHLRTWGFPRLRDHV